MNSRTRRDAIHFLIRLGVVIFFTSPGYIRVCIAQEFKHDSVNRVKSVQHADGSKVLYSYDSSGNLLQAQRFGAGHWIENPSNRHRYAVLSCSSWTACQAQAQSLGAQMVTIRNQAENDWLSATFSVSDRPAGLWIGTNDRADEGQWTWDGGEWSPFIAWAPGEPNNQGGVEHFGILQPNGTWNDGADVGTRDALIEQIPVLVEPVSGRGYQLINCGTWAQCELGAIKRGGHLVVVRSAEQNTWLYNTFAPLKTSYWGFWGGMSDAASEGVWLWSNGESASYFNWWPGEPNNFGNAEHCLQLADPRMSGAWNDVPCDTTSLWEAVIEVPVQSTRPQSRAEGVR